MKLQPTLTLIAERDAFLAFMFAYHKDPRGRRLFAVDESFIHLGLHYDVYNLYDPDDILDVQTRRHRYKGRRHVFIGGIMSALPLPDGVPWVPTREEQAFWLEEAFIIKPSDKRKRDYHASFNADDFEEWVRRVAKWQRDHGHKCIWLLDNVSYHKRKSASKVTRSSPKEVIIWALQQEKALPADLLTDEALGARTKADLAEEWRKYKAGLRSNVEAILNYYGHELQWVPAYHSDFMPIETVWACAKRKVAQGYNINTTIDDVLGRLESSFRHLTSKAIQGCFDKARRHEDECRARVQAERDRRAKLQAEHDARIADEVRAAQSEAAAAKDLASAAGV